MQKHAYLIIAHNQPRLLQTLVSLIDDERNDIFIHIDAKSNMDLFKNIRTQKSKIVFVPSVKVAWGDITQIKAELTLFEAAVNTADYDYCHLLSGVDLPIKTQDEIHSFFEKHAGTEFICLIDSQWAEQEIHKRMSYRYILQRFGKNKDPLLRYPASAIKKTFLRIQKIFHIERKYNIPFSIGSNWCSITGKFAAYIVSQKDFILKTYRQTICCDEIYKQTLLLNSDFYKNLCTGDNQFNQCLREIDWKRGNPYTYTIEDFELLKNSSNLFARKFSEDSFEIVTAIVKELQNRASLN